MLADARLIITGEDTVEVAHEALIREWPRLRGWLEDNREGLRLHRQSHRSLPRNGMRSIVNRNCCTAVRA